MPLLKCTEVDKVAYQYQGDKNKRMRWTGYVVRIAEKERYFVVKIY
jgi:ribosomal protein L34